jgi:hypothetical protein
MMISQPSASMAALKSKGACQISRGEVSRVAAVAVTGLALVLECWALVGGQRLADAALVAGLRLDQFAFGHVESPHQQGKATGFWRGSADLIAEQRRTRCFAVRKVLSGAA